MPSPYSVFFFFNDPSTPEIYTLSLHDALPISNDELHKKACAVFAPREDEARAEWLGRLQTLLGNNGKATATDRKSTRLNSSHRCISYAVFCLKKKKKKKTPTTSANNQTTSSHP